MDPPELKIDSGRESLCLRHENQEEEATNLVEGVKISNVEDKQLLLNSDQLLPFQPLQSYPQFQPSLTITIQQRPEYPGRQT